MDTALALMDAREPVYPLDIVQGMRDQRACMVQNVVSNFVFKQEKICGSLFPFHRCLYLFVLLQSQYRFVCECICAAYVKLARSDAISRSEDT